MRLSLLGRCGLLAALSTLLWNFDAQALQFSPSPTARLHYVTDPATSKGAQWNTGGLGSGGQINYNSVLSGTDPGLLTMTGVVDLLNYFDPSDPNCPTTGNPSCQINFAPDLVLTLEAQFDSLTVTPLGGSFFQVDTNFSTTLDGQPDIVITDPNDGTVVLEADWSAGIIGGSSSTTGLISTVFWDNDANSVVAGPNVTGFSIVDLGTPFGSLFEDGSDAVKLDLATFDNFGPPLDDLVNGAISSGVLGSFTAEGQGQVFRVEAGEFVPIPEPTTLGLAGLAVGALLWAHRKARRRGAGQGGDFPPA